MFKVSEKLHIAVLLLLELEKYHVSAGYLEEIAGALRKQGIIEGKQGPGGGYRLATSSDTLTLETICTAIEKDLNLVACQDPAHACPAESVCQSKYLWDAFNTHVKTFLQNTTLKSMKERS
jgi:Rrf2 family iron-sulfur cluster assembly transcriptional regulator